MARELRGTRYLDGGTPGFGDMISKDLPYMDFDETLDWYAWADGFMNDRDRALLDCNDRYYLLTVTCHRPDAWHPWIFERCREVEAAPDDYLDLWARGHYKSSIGTFAGIIQEVMIDPEITIAILSGTNKVAMPFLTQIQQEFENNEDLKRIHSDVLWNEPKKEAPIWSREKGIVVKRKGRPKECTVEAFGVIDGMRTGKHYDLLDFDDLIDESMVDNPDVVKKVTLRWELAGNLGRHTKKTRKWHWGTRYSFSDSYGIMLDRSILKARIHPATDNGQINGNPVLMQREEWDKLKSAQRGTVNAQMLLNPLAGTEATFSMLNLSHYEVIPAIMNVYIMIDPSKGRTKRSDRTAIAVVGLDVAKNKYLLDGYCHRMKLSRRFELISQLREKWANFPGVQAVRIGYEQYGMQVDLEVIKEYQERDDDYFDIEELNTTRDGTYSKGDRISRLEPDFNRGLFRLPAVVYHPDYGGGISGSALWDIWGDEEHKRALEAGQIDNPAVGTVVYRPMQGLTRQQRVCEATHQQYRIVHALKRRNEDGDMYDLTRSFIEEYRLHPFAPHDDFLDSTSRIFDLEPAAPVPFESVKAEPRIHMDS